MNTNDKEVNFTLVDQTAGLEAPHTLPAHSIHTYRWGGPAQRHPAELDAEELPAAEAQVAPAEATVAPQVTREASAPAADTGAGDPAAAAVANPASDDDATVKSQGAVAPRLDMGQNVASSVKHDIESPAIFGVKEVDGTLHPTYVEYVVATEQSALAGETLAPDAQTQLATATGSIGDRDTASQISEVPLLLAAAAAVVVFGAVRLAARARSNPDSVAPVFSAFPEAVAAASSAYKRRGVPEEEAMLAAYSRFEEGAASGF
mmetsp:Transcript_29881/g.91711  ORF Transcript_29881/g.91711 Transcript_29881/m.91711 type:complete len:262 (+) Transcript_29881:2243-3028(+)|eukprot:scaffold83310_cov25-Tisochrysis_lutea.AAC.3